MKKSIVWTGLAAAALALTGCSGGEPAKEAKPPAAKKKGGKEEVNPWAKDAPSGNEPEPASKSKGKKGGDDATSPWAKETPKPAKT